MALYVPLGTAVVLGARTRRQYTAGLAVLVCLTGGVEVLQSLPLIGRSCDTIDVIDNLIGVTAGAALALLGMSSRSGPTVLA